MNVLFIFYKYESQAKSHACEFLTHYVNLKKTTLIYKKKKRTNEPQLEHPE